MRARCFCITGATGLVGSHLAEACMARGYAVHALVRPGSDTSLLEACGATIHRGDLRDTDAIGRALEGTDVVVHCAAKVGDWGPVEEYRAVNVAGLHAVLEACRGKPLQRFVHISSLGVYRARHHHGTDETEPLPARHIDGYTQTKVEGEQLALRYQHKASIPVVVLRPGFIYGPRDQTVLPKLVEMLRSRQLRYFWGGQQAMNSIYVGNLIEAIFLASTTPDVIGKAFNLTDGEFVSKRRFVDAITRELNLPRASALWLPIWGARLVASVFESGARWWGATEPPPLTQARLKFIALNLDFSIERAKRELGYRPRFTFDQGMAETLAWFKEQSNGKPAVPAGA